MKNKLTILLLVLIQFFSLKSQNLIDTSLYVSLDTTLNYYTIKPNLIVTPSQLLNLSNNNLKLFSPVSFQLFKTNLDIKNNKHYKYRYLYSGIPIENTIFAIHCDSNDVVKGLNQLNSLMSRFVEDAKDIGNKQIRAVKSSSADLYSR